MSNTEGVKDLCNTPPELLVTAPTYHLTHGVDAIEWLHQFPSESVDLVVTDPAYESLEKHRAVGTTTRLKQSKSSSNVWFPIFPNARFAQLMNELYRVLKKNTHCYLFCDQETMFQLVPVARAQGFRFWKPIVWNKMKIGMGYHYRAQYELILFFEKGKRKLNDLGMADVIDVPRLKGPQYYPTQKPAEVSRRLILQSTVPGQLVIDPFMGSGSSGIAAMLQHCHYSGNDIQDTPAKYHILDWCDTTTNLGMRAACKRESLLPQALKTPHRKPHS